MQSEFPGVLCSILLADITLFFTSHRVNSSYFALSSSNFSPKNNASAKSSANRPDWTNLDVKEKPLKFEVCSRQVSGDGWLTIFGVHLQFAWFWQWKLLDSWSFIDWSWKVMERHWPNVHLWLTNQHYNKYLQWPGGSRFSSANQTQVKGRLNDAVLLHPLAHQTFHYIHKYY